MIASTHAFGSNPVKFFRAARTRKGSPGHSDETGVVTDVQAGLEPERASNERAVSRLRSSGIYRRPCEKAEHALFIVTLATIGYLYFGVCLAALI